VKWKWIHGNEKSIHAKGRLIHGNEKSIVRSGNRFMGM
jgi:hypothetical protein